MVNDPWRDIDPTSKSNWDGTLGIPREPESYAMSSTPFRVEPDGRELDTGDSCLLSVSPSELRIVSIDRYVPPVDFGWLPRPEWVLSVCPVEYLDDEEAGYVIYLNGGDPFDIEVIQLAGNQ
jgi:hypothetical protein